MRKLNPPKRLDFHKLCLRYYLQRSGRVKGNGPKLIADLLELSEGLGVQLKIPAKVDDLFLKGLFDVSSKLRGRDLAWFEFKQMFSSQEKLLERWRLNLSKEQRYEIFLLAASLLGNSVADFQEGLGLNPEECDRIRLGQSPSHGITTVAAFRLIVAESGVTEARKFLKRNFYQPSSDVSDLVKELRSKNSGRLERVSTIVTSLLKAPRLTPLEVQAFKKLSERFKSSGALEQLNKLELMILLKPLLLHQARLRHHPALLKELRTWFMVTPKKLTLIAAELNLLLPALGEKPLMDRRLSDVLEEIFGKSRPHFPEAGSDFRREYYTFLQTDLCLLGAGQKRFAANIIRSLEKPVSIAPERFVYQILRSYLRSKPKTLRSEMSKKAEKEFWEILRELKIPRDAVLRALRLLYLHHRIHLRLPSTQLSVAA